MVTSSAIVALPADLDAADFSAPIAGAAALVRVVRAVGDIAPVVVAAAELLVAAARDCLAANGLGNVTVLAVPVGTLRDCLAAAVEYVAREPICADEILIHDVRYPLAPAAVAGRVVGGLQQWDVVLPTLPMTDSVKTVAAHGVVLGNVDRSELAVVQYPRGYTVAALSKMLAAPTVEVVPTDLRVGTVDGDPNAFVVDLAHDRGLIEAIVTAG
ncbi:2-C-methyl-D-erythritol 4-phosphate cytidylyltransferase [Mycobacterium sp. OTB74]|nr:2-C-methyl-D-erythritol 4-phosphate cytidylyltransferase [Mycobacterium sp. OTB74]